MVGNIILLAISAAGYFVPALKFIGLGTTLAALAMLVAKFGIYEKMVRDLNAAIDRLDTEAKKFSDENFKLSENIEKQKEANAKLLIIQKQSQDLLAGLMSSGDKFTDFGKILQNTTEKNLSLTDKLQVLVSGLAQKEFKKIDINGDGVITENEMRVYFSAHNSPF